MADNQRAVLGDLVADRLDRARELLVLHPVTYTRAGAGVLFVWTDTTTAPYGHWTVKDGRCDCPDATVGLAHRALAGTCKHVALAWLVAEMDRAAAIPTPAPAPVIDEATRARRAKALAILNSLYD